VSTVYDTQNRPSYYRVDYAVSPLQGTKVWMPSPDNPVFMEAGGRLSVTPPGGSARGAVPLPGDGVLPAPLGPGFYSLQAFLPGDRDVAAKVLLSSLADLRAFYARQPRGSALWFFVPEVSVWTQTLAQEFGTQNGGQARFVVPRETRPGLTAPSTATTLVFHVMPRDTLPKEQSFAVIYPPSGATQKGAVMAGRHLVDRPDWQETDYLSLEAALSPTQDGLPEARAYVWGYISQANLKARVRFKDWVSEFRVQPFTPAARRVHLGTGASPPTWGGDPRLSNSRTGGEGDYSSTIFYAKDDGGRDRALVYVTTRKETVYELDTSRPTDFSFGTVGGPNGIRFTVAGETFESYDCSLSNRTNQAYYYACSYRDLQGRYRGSGTMAITVLNIAQVSGTVYPLVARTRTLGYTYSAYIKGWSQTWRYATDNDRPVEAGGYVTAEGKRYRIPGLEGYLSPRVRTSRPPRATPT
jgi:hypothetical protein